MANFEITGKTSLCGEIRVSGAKNEALKLISLAVLVPDEFVLDNVPRLKDVMTQLEIFEALGGKYKFEDSKLTLNSNEINSAEIPDELSGKLRASIVYAGSLLSRFGRAKIPCPGGCVIGSRSVETHLDAFRQAGVLVKDRDGCFNLTSSDGTDDLDIKLCEKSVTATENIILYLSVGQRRARVSNIAIEPEIMHLIESINQSGGDIIFDGDNQVVIKGVPSLKSSSTIVIPDRIEAGTFAIAIAVTGGEGSVFPYPSKYLEALTDQLISCGINIRIENDRAIIGKSDKIKPFSIKTEPYPGFPTDLQSPMSLVASVANGESAINEAMFDNRLGYLNELKGMGLNVEILNKHEAKIFGPAKLAPGVIDSMDLRSGITLLIAAMMAEGKTILKDAEIIDRGYENIEKKLNNAGAKIVRVE